MRVAQLAKGSVATLEVDATLVDAAREMEDNNVAAIAVCEAGVLVGIITERDVIRAVADGAFLDRTALEEYMTAAPVTLPDMADPGQALRIMLDGGFRHVPLVDEDGDPVGLLTMRDVVTDLYGASLRRAEPARA
jgi:CBS domain-containing protein